MTPVIVVMSNDGTGKPQLPGSMTVDGVRSAVDIDRAGSIGGYPAFTLRHRPGVPPIVVVKIAATAQGILAVLWIPGPSRGDTATFLARIAGTDLQDLIVRQWACEIDPVTGAITSAALTAAAGAIPTAVKAAWPIDWKLRTGGETPGDRLGTAPGAPAGAICIGATIA
jgi:hypothetical protein